MKPWMKTVIAFAVSLMALMVLSDTVDGLYGASQGGALAYSVF